MSVFCGLNLQLLVDRLGRRRLKDDHRQTLLNVHHSVLTSLADLYLHLLQLAHHQYGNRGNLQIHFLHRF